jgi:hypothetical protein
VLRLREFPLSSSLPLPHEDQSFDGVIVYCEDEVPQLPSGGDDYGSREFVRGFRSGGNPKSRKVIAEFRCVLRPGGYFGMLSVYTGPPRSNKLWRTAGGVLIIGDREAEVDDEVVISRTFSVLQRIPVYGRPRHWTRERVVAAIRKHGAGYSSGPAGLRSAAERVFGSWADACRAADIEPPRRGRPRKAPLG